MGKYDCGLRMLVCPGSDLLGYCPLLREDCADFAGKVYRLHSRDEEFLEFSRELVGVAA
jgi:hypothetical protein